MRTVYAILPPLSVTALGLVLLYFFWAGAVVSALGAMDAYGRYRDYRYLARFNYLTEHLAQFYGRSFCGRWMIGAIEPGWHNWYRRHGYRWWHVFPEDFPMVLFRRRFWHNLVKGHRV